MSVPLLSPQWSAPTTPLHHSWSGLGNVDQFRWFIRHDMISQLRLAHQELGLRHVRAVGMLCDELRTYTVDPRDWQNESRQPRYNSQIVDRCIEALLEVGIKPMITTCFTPSALASGETTVFSTRSNVSPPSDLAAWTSLVRETTRHLISAFGIAEVRTWYFEVWNEPNLAGFWSGSQAQFFELWQLTYDAIKSVDATLRVGGPSTARGEWIADSIEFGRKYDCEPDYLISHCYNNDSANGALSPFDGPQTDRLNTSPHFVSGVVRGTRKLLDELDYRGEVHWNEWGRSWFPSDDERESPNEAAFIVKTMAEVSHLADSFAYWNLSDIYDQVGYGAEEFFGGYGMLSHHSLRKPSWHAHQLLGRLGDQRVQLDPFALDSVGCTGAIVTQRRATSQVLVYQFSPADGATAPTAAQLDIDPPPHAKVARVYAIARDAHDIRQSWQAMGSPAYLSREQCSTLNAVNSLSATSLHEVTPGTPLRLQTPSAGAYLVEFDG
jgi:xylan 1,4-beta-xylosidase